MKLKQLILGLILIVSVIGVASAQSILVNNVIVAKNKSVSLNHYNKISNASPYNGGKQFAAVYAITPPSASKYISILSDGSISPTQIILYKVKNLPINTGFRVIFDFPYLPRGGSCSVIFINHNGSLLLSSENTGSATANCEARKDGGITIRA